VKILYLLDQDLDNNSGVSHKISIQTQEWLRQGHEVSIVSLQSLSFFSAYKIRLTPAKINISRRGWKIFIHLVISTWKLKDICKELDFDIVYMRYRLYAPLFNSSLKKAPLIVEINSDDIHEYKLSSFLLRTYNSAFRNKFLKSVDGLVCVSEELKKVFSSFSKPSIIIANGMKVDMNEYNKDTVSTRCSLVFIGSPNQRWHGLDKIVYLAEKFSEYDFHVIGCLGKDTNNLFYHGYLPTDEANLLVKTFDIGISTLSLYKKNMQEASPLKTRQYLAHGLPLIYAYTDTDFTSQQEFLLQLENAPNNIEKNLIKIKSFIDKVYKKESLFKEIKIFSNKVIDIENKEKKRLEFFGGFL